MPTNNCLSCRWSRERPNSPTMIDCVRYPKTTRKHSLSYCGEFQTLPSPIKAVDKPKNTEKTTHTT